MTREEALGRLDSLKLALTLTVAMMDMAAEIIETSNEPGSEVNQATVEMITEVSEAFL